MTLEPHVSLPPELTLGEAVLSQCNVVTNQLLKLSNGLPWRKIKIVNAKKAIMSRETTMSITVGNSQGSLIDLLCYC